MTTRKTQSTSQLMTCTGLAMLLSSILSGCGGGGSSDSGAASQNNIAEIDPLDDETSQALPSTTVDEVTITTPVDMTEDDLTALENQYQNAMQDSDSIFTLRGDAIEHVGTFLLKSSYKLDQDHDESSTRTIDFMKSFLLAPDADEVSISKNPDNPNEIIINSYTSNTAAEIQNMAVFYTEINGIPSKLTHADATNPDNIQLLTMIKLDETTIDNAYNLSVFNNFNALGDRSTASTRKNEVKTINNQYEVTTNHGDIIFTYVAELSDEDQVGEKDQFIYFQTPGKSDSELHFGYVSKIVSLADVSSYELKNISYSSNSAEIDNQHNKIFLIYQDEDGNLSEAGDLSHAYVSRIGLGNEYPTLIRIELSEARKDFHGVDVIPLIGNGDDLPYRGAFKYYDQANNYKGSDVEVEIDDTGALTSITEQDSSPTLSIKSSKDTFNESDGSLSTDIVFELNNYCVDDITVNFTTSGTATRQDDYSFSGNVTFSDFTNSGSFVIPAGQTEATMTVTHIDDNVLESTETLTIDFSVAAGLSDKVTLNENKIELTIKDNDAPSVTVIPQMNFYDSTHEFSGEAAIVFKLEEGHGIEEIQLFNRDTEQAIANALVDNDVAKLVIPSKVFKTELSTSSTSASKLHTWDGLSYQLHSGGHSSDLIDLKPGGDHIQTKIFSAGDQLAFMDTNGDYHYSVGEILYGYTSDDGQDDAVLDFPSMYKILDQMFIESYKETSPLHLDQLSTEMLESITQTTLMEPQIYLSATAGQLTINQNSVTLDYDGGAGYKVNLRNSTSSDVEDPSYIPDEFGFINPDDGQPRSHPLDTSTEQGHFFRVYDLHGDSL